MSQELEAASEPRLHIHALLFLLTCATTFTAGSQLGSSFDVSSGIAFAGTLMTILVCHEMGHYLVARRHGLDVSLPYFIPLPPFITLGTMGAVIRMRRPISDRNQLIDVGAAGPLAGLVAAIPLLLAGLAKSQVVASWAGPIPRPSWWPAPDGVLEGNSIAYVALKYLVHGQYLPAADGTDVQLHPMAFAAWLGLLITMINLIPIGQLDGGHIASAWLGKRHERLSSWLHRLLLAVAVAVFVALTTEARSAGWGWGDSLSRAAFAGMPWLVWACLLVYMRRLSGGVYHPPVEGEPLSGRRRALAIGMAILFLLLFTPVPLREPIL